MSKAKRKRPHLSIKLHIFISLMLLTLALVLILWISQSVFFNRSYSAVKESDAEHAAKQIGYNIDSENLGALVGQTSANYELCVQIYVFDGEEIIKKTDTGSHFLNDCFICKITANQSALDLWYTNARDNGGYYSEKISRDSLRDFIYTPDDFIGDAPSVDTVAKDSLLGVYLVEDASGLVNMILVNGTVSPPSAILKTLRTIIGIFSAIFIGIAIIFSFVLSKFISAPIEKIDKSAKKLTESGYSVSFEEKGPKEVYNLAKTLNEVSKELSSVESIRRELIANISHDLRTPLTMISGYSEVMRDLPGENTPENMQVIIDETARLTSLVNDLLDVSKLQSGTQAMDMKKICLTDVISKTVKRYDTLISHNEYKIIFESDQSVYIKADETRLLQVVYNLVNNALNYTGEDKTVRVKQEVTDDVVRVSIIDTGEGISEENLPLIWDRYYKVDKVHKRAKIGTGLGLSIVKNILLLHNSRFGVSSEIGKGSIFWFEFKLLNDE